jgi:hypothetical protein
VKPPSILDRRAANKFPAALTLFRGHGKRLQDSEETGTIRAQFTDVLSEQQDLKNLEK